MRTESVIRPPKSESDAHSLSVRMSSIIKGHVAEFTSDMDVDLVIRSIRMDPYNMLSDENRFGQRAFHLYVVKNLTTIAKLSGWGLDSPEIRYMSGIAVQGHMSRRIDWQEEQIGFLQNGGRRYQREGVTEQRLSEEKNELKHLKNLENILLTKLESFVDINFLKDGTGQKYTTILQYLGRLMEIIVDERSRVQVKQKICRRLKQGEIDAAYEIVNENLHDKYEI